MNVVNKKEFTKIFLSLVFLLALVYFGYNLVVLDTARAAQHTDDVTVTASIDEFFTLTVSTNTLALGELIDSAGQAFIGEASLTITTGSNRMAGYKIDIDSANASLDHTTGAATGTIESGTPVADDGNTDGYGAQCESTPLDCNGTFDVSGTTVGVLTGSAQEFASTNSASTGDTTTLTVKASAEDTKAPGNYEDTLTLTALTNA